MKLDIIEEKENAFFNRKEVKAVVESKVSPSRSEVRKLLAEKFSIDPEAIKINGIYGKFGSKKFDVGVNVYKSEEDKNSVESEKKKDQNPAEPEQPAEKEKPAEEVKPEEKKEEVKEEKPKEEEKPEEAKPEEKSE